MDSSNAVAPHVHLIHLDSNPIDFASPETIQTSTPHSKCKTRAFSMPSLSAATSRSVSSLFPLPHWRFLPACSLCVRVGLAFLSSFPQLELYSFNRANRPPLRLPLLMYRRREMRSELTPWSQNSCYSIGWRFSSISGTSYLLHINVRLVLSPPSFPLRRTRFVVDK